jgi:hypothetical protein
MSAGRDLAKPCSLPAVLDSRDTACIASAIWSQPHILARRDDRSARRTIAVKEHEAGPADDGLVRKRRRPRGATSMHVPQRRAARTGHPATSAAARSCGILVVAVPSHSAAEGRSHDPGRANVRSSLRTSVVTALAKVSAAERPGVFCAQIRCDRPRIVGSAFAGHH